MSIENLRIVETKTVETDTQVWHLTERKLVCDEADTNPMFVGKSGGGSAKERHIEVVGVTEREPTLDELKQAESLYMTVERWFKHDTKVEPTPQEVLGISAVGAIVGGAIGMVSTAAEMRVPGTISSAFIGATALGIYGRQVSMKLNRRKVAENKEEMDKMLPSIRADLRRLQVVRNAIAQAETTTHKG